MVVAYLALAIAFFLGGLTVWLFVSSLGWVVYVAALVFLMGLLVADWKDKQHREPTHFSNYTEDRTNTN